MADLNSGPQDVRLLRLRVHGMFSNVNEVVEQARLAERDGYRFHIDWSRSCYRDPERAGDPWEYYFEPCFPDLPDPGPNPKEVVGGPAIACTRENVITPRLEDGKCNPLLLPHDRNAAHAYITRHLKLKPEVKAVIDDFVQGHFVGPVIGAHIRGPGRLDGGSGDMRRQINPEGGVPYDVYFKAVNNALEARPSARILVCSDSSEVIERTRHAYGERVISYAASRSEFGEMHADHPENEGLEFSPYQLGLDVLVEAYLMARCDFLVHGNSNVANFVLSANPDLAHEYVPA